MAFRTDHALPPPTWHSRKVNKINNGESPIYEEGLSGLLKKHININLRATTDLSKAILKSQIYLEE